MLNDSSMVSVSFGATQSKKGLSNFKKFQARVKHKVGNIDFVQPTIEKTTIWDKLRGNK